MLKLQQEKDLALEELVIPLDFSGSTDILIQQLEATFSQDLTIIHIKDGYKVKYFNNQKRLIKGWQCHHYDIEPNDILQLRTLNGKYLQFPKSETSSISSNEEISQYLISSQQVLTQSIKFEKQVNTIAQGKIPNLIGSTLITNNGWTLFHWICFYGNLPALQDLNLKAVVYSPDQETEDGWTGLMIAVRQRQLPIIKYLLNYCNPNITTSKTNAFQLACRMAETEIIKTLFPFISDEIGTKAFSTSTQEVQRFLLALQNKKEQVTEVELISQISPFIAQGYYYTPGSLSWTVKRRYLVIDPIKDLISRYTDSTQSQLRRSLQISQIRNISQYTSLTLKSGFIYFVLESNELPFVIGCENSGQVKLWISLMKRAQAYINNILDKVQLKNKFQTVEIIDIDKNQIETERIQRSETQIPNLKPKHPAVTIPRFEHITFQKLLGQGAFGSVFLAQFQGNLYAVKVMNKQKLIKKKALRYSVVESQILQSLNSPFLIRLSFAFQTPSYLYLGMDVCHGGDLYSLLSKVGHFKEEEAKFYLSEILLGLQELHNLNIIYRDIKPENILLSAKGHVKLADFGLARQNVPFEVSSKSFCGSPAYVAPEIASRIHNKVGKYCDYYSFGILAYELLNGTPPYLANSVAELFQKKINEPIPYPPRISDVARSLIEQLTNIDPYQRINFQQAKSHPFFDQVNWDNIQNTQAPHTFSISTEDNIPPLFYDQDYSTADEEEIDRVVGYDFARL